MAFKIILIFAALAALVNSQRPFYAGLRPIGFPAVEVDLISNRFGDDAPVPIEVKNDRNVVNKFEAMPIDNRPFWYINWKAYEDLRKRPQTYPQRPNSFIDK